MSEFLIKDKLESLVEEMQEPEWFSGLAPHLQMRVTEIHAQGANAIRDSLARAMCLVAEREPSLSGSNIGNCPRQVWLKISGAPQEKFNDRTKITFFMGDCFEILMVSWIRILGLLDKDIEIREDLLQKEIAWRGIKGHVDLPLRIRGKNFLAELKTRAEYSFKRECKEGMNDEGGYPQQWNHYSRSLEEETGEDWSEGLFIICNKNTGHWAEIRVKRDDAKYVLLAEEQIGLVGSTDLPVRPDWATAKGGTLDHWKCSYCGVKRDCWNIESVTFDSKGRPQYHVSE
jgi:hypothetical protein